jgi:hypothetical protein
MSFLDNLENSLKSLEGNEERDLGRDRAQREADRQQALAAAPHAERLKKSPFTNELLTAAVRIGHSSRTKVNMMWSGTTLRLDAREQRMELTPTPEGIIAVFFQHGAETGREVVDLAGDPETLARRWLSPLGEI